MKTVLLAGNNPGATNPLIPVAKKLTAEGRVNVVVLGHGTAEQILRDAEVPFKTIKDFRLTDVSGNSMELLLRHGKPDLVLVGTASQEGKANDIIEQTLVQACKTAHTKSVAVLDAWLNYSQRFTDERTDNHLDCLPDKILVMDQVAKDDMLAEKFPVDKLVITGNPAFDVLAQTVREFSEQDRQRVRRYVGLPQSTLFFFAGSVFSSLKDDFGYWDMDILEVLAGMLKKFPNVGLAVGPHPRMKDDHPQDLQRLKAFIEQFGGNIKLVEGIKSLPLAQAADLSIVSESSMGNTFVLMGLPCISLQPGLKKKPDPLLVSRKDIVPHAYDKATCQRVLEEVVHPATRMKILERYGDFTTDGKATDRVVKLVYSLLS